MKRLSAKDVRKLIIFGVLVLLSMIALAVLLAAALNNERGKAPAYSGGAFGLFNVGHIMAPDLMTKADLESAYASREEITLPLQNTFETVIAEHLSAGQFQELDSFLSKQQAQYRNADGDAGQELRDWRSIFASLRSDLTNTLNLNQSDNPVQILQAYQNPDVLAAAIAYAPASLKMYAFEDRSASILPPADRDIQLKAGSSKPPLVTIADVNKGSPTFTYIDLRTYDMELYGVAFQLVIVGDTNGLYRPYTLKSIDDTYASTGFTRAELEDLKGSLGPYTTIDDVYHVTHVGD